MKTPLLALLAAASVAFAASTGTNSKKPSGPTPPGGNKTAAAEKAEKKPKKDAKAEAPAPEAAADPVSLVVQTVDATTQMALDAAKAAQAEADKLAAIGTGKIVGSASNAKLAEAVVGTGAAVAKELSKPKKESEGEGEAKPESKKPEKPEPKAEKKPTAEKPKKAAGV